MVELIPKKQKVQMPGWVNMVLYLAFGALVISLIAFVLVNRLVAAAESELKDVRGQIVQANSPERLALKAELLDLKQKIEDFSFLLASHRDADNALGQLEQNTHPLVWFSEFSADIPKLTMRVSGQAQDFIAVGQQIIFFEQSEYLKNSKLSDLSFDKKGVRFLIDFSLNPKVFE